MLQSQRVKLYKLVMNQRLRVEDHSSLQGLLSAWLKAPGTPKRGRQKHLAEKLRLHSTLMSQIVRGHRPLSEEHAARLCDVWKLDDIESEYVLLLARRDQVEHPRLKATINRRMIELREKLGQISRRVHQHVVLSDAEKARYYASWIHAGVRLAAEMEGSIDARAIVARLGLPIDAVNSVLQFLETRGLLKRKDDGWQAGATTVHVPATSEYATSHHRNWRVKVLDALERCGEGDLVFTSPMTLSGDAMAKARKILLEAIDQIASIVPKSKSERFAVLNIDFLRLCS